MRIFVSIITLLAMASVATADYTLTPQINGETVIVVGQGGLFSLDLVLTIDANDFHDSAIFTVEFSEPGFIYEGYAWGAPYETGGIDDWSEPALGDLPVTIGVDTYEDLPGFDANAADVYFENLTPLGSNEEPLDDMFTTGTLVTMDLRVPIGAPIWSIIEITAVPDSFDNGTELVTTTGGTLFLLINLQGDASLDGYVDDDDLSLLLTNWHTAGSWAQGNFNADDTIDDDDLSLLLTNWHSGTPPTAGNIIPEPATIALLILGSVGMLRRRH